MNSRYIWLLPWTLLFIGSGAFAMDNGSEARTRELYGAMDQALSAGDQKKALEFYHGIVSLGTAAAPAINKLVTSAPLSPKTYVAACSLLKDSGNGEAAVEGLRYLLRSPAPDDTAKLKCLQALNSWGDTTINADAENLFNDKERNINLRVVAGNVFRKLEPIKAKARFLAVLDDGSEDTLIHYKAVQHLGNYSGPEIDEKIKSYVLNGPKAAELAKERALVLLHSRRGTGAVGAFAEVLLSTNTSVSLKSRSIAVLSAPAALRGGGARVLEDLVKRTGDPGLKRQALRALNRPAPEEAGPALRKKELENAPRVKTELPARGK